MKFPSKEELNEYTTALTVGGLKGVAAGSVVSLGLWKYTNRKMPQFRKFGSSLRTFAAIFPPLALGITWMEFASRDFEIERYGYNERPSNAIVVRQGAKSVGADGTDAQELGPSITQRALLFCTENKYKIIMGAWAGSLAGSFWLVNRDKYMSKSQKIVQARMYAQGLTVVLLLASMALSVGGPKPKRTDDLTKGWEDVLNQEVAKEKAEHSSLSLKQQQKDKQIAEHAEQKQQQNAEPVKQDA